MGKIVITENGKIRDLDDVEWAEKIIEMKNTRDPWEVIDELIRFWAKTAADEEQAMEINVAQYREQLKDKKFGTTEMGAEQERRFKLAFPRTLMLMIRSIYKAEDLKMDEKFFSEFGRRYPAFKVAEV